MKRINRSKELGDDRPHKEDPIKIDKMRKYRNKNFIKCMVQ